MPLRGYGEHLGAEIQAGRLRAALGEGERNIASAAAQIERTGVGRSLRECHHAAFPTPVQAEALEVVQEIVTAGDAGEEVIDLRRALVTGRIKFIAHAA